MVADMMDRNFDVIVIGCGSAGMAFSSSAAKLGAKVLVVEQDELGGTCINCGCVPKKLMWELAHTIKQSDGLNQRGLVTNSLNLDIHALQGQISRKIDDLRKTYRERLEMDQPFVCDSGGTKVQESELLHAT